MLLARNFAVRNVASLCTTRRVILMCMSTNPRHPEKDDTKEFDENEFGLRQVQKGTYSQSLTLLKRVSVASAMISVTALVEYSIIRPIYI